MIYVLCNRNRYKDSKDTLFDKLRLAFGGSEFELRDINQAEWTKLRGELEAEDRLVILGGDGTLSRYFNLCEPQTLNKTYYFPAGTGNDFARDLGSEKDKPIDITNLKSNLPSVKVNGQELFFFNGVGCGLDSYTCGEVERQRRKSRGNIRYVTAVLKGLVGGFKPFDAVVTVDGVQKKYRKVWMLTLMKGRYLGNGMMIAPGQDRDNEEGGLSLMLVHSLPRAFLVGLFPTIFKGTHIKIKKYVQIHTGSRFSFSLSRKLLMQLDGELVPNVEEYETSGTKKD